MAEKSGFTFLCINLFLLDSWMLLCFNDHACWIYAVCCLLSAMMCLIPCFGLLSFSRFLDLNDGDYCCFLNPMNLFRNLHDLFLIYGCVDVV